MKYHLKTISFLFLITLLISGCGSSGSTSDSTSGSVIDGYISGATVFADENENGIWDSGEVKTTTDSSGKYDLIDAKGPIIASGGVDISTGLPFEGKFTAPEGSAIVSPLTTLVHELMNGSSKLSKEEANAKVLNTLLLSPDVDLLTFDPIKSAEDETLSSIDRLTAINIQSKAVQIANIMSQTAAVLKGGGVSDKINGSIATIKSLGILFMDNNVTTNVADSTFLKSVIEGSVEIANIQEINTSKINSISDEISDAIANVNSIVNAILSNNSDSKMILSKFALSQIDAKEVENIAFSSANSGDASSLVAKIETLKKNNVANATDSAPKLRNTILSVVENLSSGSDIGNIEISDMGSSLINSIKLLGTNSSDFTVLTSGVVKIADGVTIDYETTNIYNLTAIATNLTGDSEEVNVTINVTNLTNEVLPVIEENSFSLSENSQPGTVLGNISVSNINSLDSNILNFIINGIGGNNFIVDKNGTVSVSSGADLNYESISSYYLSVVAVNDAGLSNSANLNIEILNVSEIVPTIENFTVSIDKTISELSTIGSIAITNSGDSDINQFVLKETNGTISTHFEVSNSGTITIKSGANINNESRTTYDLKAIATNDKGDSNEVSVTININDGTTNENGNSNNSDYEGTVVMSGTVS